MIKTYDVKVEELAEYFVDAEIHMAPDANNAARGVRKELIHTLALAIQGAVEEFWSLG